MPWYKETVMSQRREFIKLIEGSINKVSDVCRRFGISRRTGYKWLNRFEAEGEEGRPQGPHWEGDPSSRPKDLDDGGTC